MRVPCPVMPKTIPTTTGVDAILARPKRTRKVTLAWDQEDAAKLDAMRQRQHALQTRVTGGLAPDRVATDLAEVTAMIDEFVEQMNAMVWYFESIGTRAVDALKTKYQPSKEQQSKHKAMNPGALPLDTDPERFHPALVAATCAGIDMPDGDRIEAVDEDDVRRMFDTALSANDQTALINAAMLVDISGSAIEDFLKG